MRTRCGFKPIGENPQAAAPQTRGCLSVQQLQAAAATDEERTALIEQLEALGVEAVLKNCKATPDSHAIEIQGKVCAKNTTGKVCYFEAKMNCAFKGKTFEYSAAGACTQPKCGTFAGCMRDKETDSNTSAFSDLSNNSEPEVWINPATGVLEIRR